MELRDALRGTGSVRAFTDEPVTEATVATILDDARYAPSGGNRQGWRVAIVRDRATRRALGEQMQLIWNEYMRHTALGVTPFSTESAALPPGDGPAPHHPNLLVEGIEQVPVVLAVAVDLGRVSAMDSELARTPIVGGASIYPFCWSILLAARERGLGGVLTTFLSRVEPEVGPLLGLPPRHALAATIFLGHPVHQPTKLSRRAVSTFATLDRFDGPPLHDPADRPAG